MKNYTLPLILFLASIITISNAQSIIGDTIACNGSYKYYTFPTIDSLNYTWHVGGGNIVNHHGDTLEVIWTTNVQGLITLTERDSDYVVSQYTLWVDLFPLPEPDIIPSFISNCTELIITDGPKTDEQISSTRCYSVCDSTPMSFYAMGSSNSTFEWVVLGAFDTLYWTSDSIGLIWTEPGQGLVAMTEITEQGCEQLVSFCVEINEKPKATLDINNPNASGDTLEVCKGQSVQFTNTSVLDENSGEVVWYIGGVQVGMGNNPIIDFNNAGTFELEMIVKNECNCRDTARAYIIVDNLPTATIECPGVLCEGDTGTFYATSSCSSYNYTVIGSNNYYTDSNSITIVWDNVPSNGYGQIILDGSNCSGVCPEQTVIDVPIIKQNVFITGNQTICNNSTDYVNYSVPFWPGTFYEWSILSQNGDAALFNESSSEVTLQLNNAEDSIILQVAYYNDLLECGDTSTIVIQLKDKLELTGPNVVCASDTFTFTVSPGTSTNPYIWTTFSLTNNIVDSTEHTTQTDSSFTYSFSVAGDYIVLVQNTDFCNVAARQIFVTEIPPTPIGITGEDTICIDNFYTYTTQLTHTDYYAEWMIIDGTDTIIDQGTEIGYKFNSNGPYQVRVRQYNVNNPSCHSEDLVLDVYLELPFDIAINGKDTVCANSTDIYTSNLITGRDYSWTLSNINVGSIFNATSETIEIQWNNILSPTNVYLYLSVNSCGNVIKDTMMIHVRPGPEPNIVMTGSLCVGEVVHFEETNIASGTYNWITTGPSNIIANYGNSIDIMYNAPGTHLVNLEVQNPDGCIVVVEDVVNFYINPLPVANISHDGGELHYCLSDSDSVGVTDIYAHFVRTSQFNPYYRYEWYCNSTILTGSTNQGDLAITNSNICIPTNAEGEANIYLKVTDTTTGCYNLSDTFLIYIDSCSSDSGCIGNINAQITATRYCDSVYFQSSYTPNQFYIDSWWYIDDYSPYSNQQNFGHIYNESGVYMIHNWVQYYENDGTNITDSTAWCIKDTSFYLAIPAIPNFEYEFECDNNNNMQVQFNRTTDYVALYTSFETPTWTIYNNSNTLIYIGTTPPTNLAGGTYLVTLTEIYSFDNGNIVTGLDTCSITKEIIVPTPAQAAFTFAPNPVCEGSPVHFTSQSTGDIISWHWDYGDGSSSLLPDSSVRTYEVIGNKIPSLTITDKYGCFSFVEDFLTVNPDNFNQIIIGDSIACLGDDVVLEVSIDPDHLFDPINTTPITYLWSTGESTSSIAVTETGTYSVTMQDLYGCVETAEFPVLFFNVPAATITGPHQVCSSEDFELEGPQHVGSLSYIWQHSTDNITWSTFSTNAVYYGEGNTAPFYPYQSHYVRLIINTAIAGVLQCPDTSSVFEIEVLPPLNTPQIAVDYNCELPVNMYFANLSDYTAPNYHWSTGVVNEDTILADFTGLYAISLRDSFGCATRGVFDFKPLPMLNDLSCGCVEVCDTSLPAQVATHITTDQDWWLMHNGMVIDSGYSIANLILNLSNQAESGTYSLAIAGSYYGVYCTDTLADYLDLTVVDCCPDSVWATLNFMEDTICNNELPLLDVDFNYNIFVGIPQFEVYQEVDSADLNDGSVTCWGDLVPISTTNLSDTVLEIFVIPHNGDSLGNATCIGDTVWASVYFEPCSGCDSLALSPYVDYWFSNGMLNVADASEAPYGYHLVEMWYNGQYYSGAPGSVAQFKMENINTCDTVFYTISYFLEDVCCTASCYEVICLDCEDIDMNIDVQTSLSGNTWYLTYNSSYTPTYLSWTFPDGTQQAGNVSTNPNIMFPNYVDNSGAGGQVCVISSIKIGIDTCDCGTIYTQCCNVPYCFDLNPNNGFSCEDLRNYIYIQRTLNNDSSYSFSFYPDSVLYHPDIMVYNINWYFGDGSSESGNYQPTHSYLCSPYGDTTYYGYVTLEIDVYHDGMVTRCIEDFKFMVFIPQCSNYMQAKVYPNPADNNLFIKFINTDVEEITYRVYNDIGKMIYSKGQVDFALETIDIQQWSEGIYTIVIKNNDQMQIEKFIKKQ